MTNDEKLDSLIAGQASLHADLRVHIAKDEAQWERVADAEDSIKEITKDAARFSKKQAAILATLSGGVATLASVVTKALF